MSCRASAHATTSLLPSLSLPQTQAVREHMPDVCRTCRLTHGMRDPNFGKPRVPAHHAPAASLPSPVDTPSSAAQAARQLLQDDSAAAAPAVPATNITGGVSYAGSSDLSCVGCSGYDTRTQVLPLASCHSRCTFAVSWSHRMLDLKFTMSDLQLHGLSRGRCVLAQAFIQGIYNVGTILNVCLKTSFKMACSEASRRHSLNPHVTSTIQHLGCCRGHLCACIRAFSGPVSKKNLLQLQRLC